MLLVLHLVPPLLWWLLAVLVFSLLNAAFSRELWANTPGAEKFFLKISLICMGILPWLLTYLAWQIATAMEHWFWSLLWRLAGIAGIIGCFLVAGLTFILMCLN